MEKSLKLFTGWLLILAFLFTPGHSASATDDVTGHWAEEDLRFMIDRKILQGDTNGYHPNNIITRGQFAVLLSRTLNLKPTMYGGIEFHDVDNTSGYMGEILAAVNAELITGYPDRTFRPSDPIKRQHMAVMMKRAMDYLEIAGEDPGYRFADEEEILSTYRTEIYDLAGAGIFKGSPQADGSYLFRPMNHAHRWEAATVLKRLIEVDEAPRPDMGMGYATVTGNVSELYFPDGTETTYPNSTVSVWETFDSFEEASAAAGSFGIVFAPKHDLNFHKYGISEDYIVRPLGNIGSVYSRESKNGSTLTYVYEHPADIGKPDKAFTYVKPDTEMEYVEATASYVKVKLSGRPGYIKQENAFMPNSFHWSYYYEVNDEGELVLETSYTVRPFQEYIRTEYIVGKAPKDMNNDRQHDSWDQINYREFGLQKHLAFYNYYQFLPLRTQTIYTAEELDDYILAELERKEASGDGIYRDATKKSKLLGIGSLLKKIEDEKNINALLLLAHAQHNSDYGMSGAAQENNNLFGLADNPEASEKRQFLEYQSIEENIYVLADEWNNNYITPKAKNAHGAFLGTKAVGINVKYNSDPYWGAKVAGHAYLIDKALGGSDYDRYKIDITVVDDSLGE